MWVISCADFRPVSRELLLPEVQNVKGGAKMYHWGGAKPYHLGGA